MSELTEEQQGRLQAIQNAIKYKNTTPEAKEKAKQERQKAGIIRRNKQIEKEDKITILLKEIEQYNEYKNIRLTKVDREELRLKRVKLGKLMRSEI